jgi:hypothetical protein
MQNYSRALIGVAPDVVMYARESAVEDGPVCS